MQRFLLSKLTSGERSGRWPNLIRQKTRTRRQLIRTQIVLPKRSIHTPENQRCNLLFQHVVNLDITHMLPPHCLAADYSQRQSTAWDENKTGVWFVSCYFVWFRRSCFSAHKQSTNSHEVTQNIINAFPHSLESSEKKGVSHAASFRDQNKTGSRDAL